MDTEYGVVLFDATQGALRAEKELKKAGLLVKLIPVPREISSDCGVCVRFRWKFRERVEEVLTTAGVRFTRIILLDKSTRYGG